MISTIDGFLGPEEACASFHDARLLSLQINYEKRELISEWELCVGDSEATERSDRERTRRGKLQLSGLSFWVVEPHGHLLIDSMPWLASDGPLLDAGTETSKELAKHVPSGASAWYMYFSDWNAFAYCCAEDGVFAWIE
jgi:hypothetical protein